MKITSPKNTRETKKDIYSVLVESINSVVNLPVSIWILDKEQKTLIIKAAVGLPLAYVRKAKLDISETSITGEAFKTGKIVEISDVLSDRRWKYKKDAEEMGWKSVLCVPVKVRGSVIGVTSIYSFAKRSFSDMEKHLISDYATRLELALETEKMSQSLDQLLTIGQKVESHIAKHPESVYQEIVNGFAKVTGADCVVLYPYDSYRENFYNIDHVVAYGLQQKLQPTDKPRSEGGMASYIKREGEVIKSNIAEEDTALLTSPFIKREGINAFIGVALQIAGKYLGILYVDFRKSHAFTSEELKVIHIFAHQAAILINNTNLYQQRDSRAKALAKLNKVTSHIVSISPTHKSLKKLLMQISKSAQDVLGADLIDLYEYVQEYNEYILPPIQVGERFHSVIKNKIYPDDVVCNIVKGEKPKYFTDAQQESALTQSYDKRQNVPKERFVSREKLLSVAAVPMFAKNEIVGVLFASYRSPQTFHQQQKELIELFAGQAAIAIYNSRLYEESLLRSKRLELVRNVAAAVSSATNVRTTLQLAVDGLAKVFNVKQSAAALFDEEGEYANILVEYLEPGCVSALGYKLPLKNNPQIDRIIETKKPLIIFDVQNDPIMAHIKDIMAIRKTRSLMVVPIVINDTVVGTIGVDAFEQQRHFTEEEAKLAQAIANQAAATILISRQLDDRLNDFHALQDISEQMLEGDLGVMLDLIAERAIELTGAKHGGVWLINKARTALELGGHANKAQYKQLPLNIPLDKNSENSFSKMVVLNRQSHLSADVRKDKNYKPWYENTLSELTVPIIYKDRVIGTINVESPRENSFTDDDKRLLEAMAGQAAIVVQNARLLERLNTLDDIGVELTSGIRLKEGEILETIRNQAQRLIGAQDMYIALYNENSGEIRFPLATQKGEQVEYPTRKANMEKRGKTEEIIFTRKPILHKTKKEAEKWYGQSGHEEKVGLIQPSWLGVPMIVGERVLGVIAIYDLEEEHAYDEQDLQFFSTMASQAAIALDNATLYYDVNQKLKGANQQLETILNIINAAELHSDLHEFLQDILKGLLESVNAKNGTIQLYDHKRGELIIWAKVGSVIDSNYQHIPLEMGLTGRSAKEKHSIYMPDVKASSEYINYISDTRSEYATPMLIGDRLIGVLNVEDPMPDAISLYNRQLVELLGNQIAILIRQKLLMRELEEKRLVDQVNESLGLVTAEVAHKVGNAAGKIRFLARERLRDAPNISEAQKKDIQIILRNVEDMITATDDLFKPFGMEPKSEITIEEMIRVAVGQCALPKNIEITTKLEAGLPKVSVQVTKVQSYLAELLNNAIKYTVKGMAHRNVYSEKIEIVGQCSSDGFVEILFTNHGPTIPSDRWESIFRVFSARGQKSEDDQSYGLGLWGTRATTQQQGGDVFLLESNDEKTTFVVRFPPA